MKIINVIGNEQSGKTTKIVELARYEIAKGKKVCYYENDKPVKLEILSKLGLSKFTDNKLDGCKILFVEGDTDRTSDLIIKCKLSGTGEVGNHFKWSHKYLVKKVKFEEME